MDRMGVVGAIALIGSNQAFAQDKDQARYPDAEVAASFDPGKIHKDGIDPGQPVLDTLAPPNDGKGEPGVWDDLIAIVHAPIHYQDTDDALYEGDYLAPFDYDNDWIAWDNWDNFPFFQDALVGTAYYSVVETCTHWFVTYTFFHPKDWDTYVEQEHENDSEGILEVIRKDGGYGQLEAMITVYHYDFYSYTVPWSSLTDGSEDIDGDIRFGAVGSMLRPMTSQQARGHGIKAFPNAGDFTAEPGEDGIIYFPGWNGALPDGGTDYATVYGLRDQFDTLWPLELADAAVDYKDTDTFYEWGVLRGNSSGGCGDGISLTCKDNSAKMPWKWDDYNDGDDARPDLMALDPATLVDIYFNGLGSFGKAYVSNRYAEDLRDAGWTSGHRPTGLDGDIDLDALYGRLGATCP